MTRSWLTKICVLLIADLIVEMFEYFLKMPSLRLDYLLNDLARIKCKEIKNQILIKSFWEKERIPKNENGSMSAKNMENADLTICNKKSVTRKILKSRTQRNANGQIR